MIPWSGEFALRTAHLNGINALEGYIKVHIGWRLFTISMHIFWSVVTQKRVHYSGCLGTAA